MAQDTLPFGQRLEQLEAALATLDKRLGALERSVERGVASAPFELASATGMLPGHASRAEGAFETSLVLPILGRTFIVFGGAFLLRALSESNRLPPAAGIVLGLLYALAWMVAADRAAARGAALGATGHAVAAIGIGLPILWEATTRFQFLAPSSAMAMVGTFLGAAFLVAWIRGIQSLAGLATIGGVITIVGLAMAVGGIVPATFTLVVMGFVTLWLGYDRDWYWMRWPTAVAANLAVLELATRAVRAEAPESASMVIALQLLLLGGYLTMFAIRTLVKGRLVIPFEVVQTLCVLAIGLGGAVWVAQQVGSGDVALGAVGIALGAGAYGAAFAFVDRRQGLGENFYFYATLALILTLTGLAVVLPRGLLVAALSALAVLAAVLAGRFSRAALVLHSAVYAAVAASVSGLLANALVAFVGSPAAGWPSLSAWAWMALAAATISLVIPAPTRGGTSRVPRVALALIVVAGAGGAVVLTAAPGLAGSPAAPGTLAMLRTTILAGAAILLAIATRHERAADLGRLLYPALALCAVKLVVEDFRHAEAATLFVSLALFGVALVAAPRLARRSPAVT